MRHFVASLLVAAAFVMAACGATQAPTQSEGGTGQTQQASSGGEQQGQQASPAPSDSAQQQSSTQDTSTSSSTLSPSTTTSSGSTQSSEAEEPEPATPTLPGIAPPDIYLNLEKEPYGFQFSDWHWGNSIHSKCGQSFDWDTGADLSACIYTDDVNHVVWIEAEVAGMSADAAEWLLPYVATAPFDGNDPEKAAAWVKQNWRKVREGKPISTTIGPARFQLLGNGKTYVALEIKPVEGFDEWLASLPTD